MHENFKALKWVIILSTERLYYLKNRAKYEEFLTINVSYPYSFKWISVSLIFRNFFVKLFLQKNACILQAMLQKVNNLLSLDDFLNYFRGRMLYEYVCYSTREMTGGLLNQPILLKTAISCIEEVSLHFYMFEFRKILN